MASMGFRAPYGRGGGMNVKRSSIGQVGKMIQPIPGSSIEQSWVPNPLVLERGLAWRRFPEEVYANASEMTRKIIPFNTAMQRELAFRKKKMEKSKAQTPKDFQEPPMTLRGMSSNQKVVGIKRPPPLENHASYKQKVFQPNPAVYYCKECQLVCSGDFNIRQHYQGRKHKAKLEQLALQNSGKIGYAAVRCDVCGITCMNELNYQEHILGKKHTACVQAISNAKTAISNGADEVIMEEFEEMKWDNFVGSGKEQCTGGMPIIW